MSYRMEQVQASFFLPHSVKDQAFQVLHDYVLSRPRYWIDGDGLDDAESLEDLLRACRWNPQVNKSGDIIDICFEGGNWGDDEKILQILAPYTFSNSHIRMKGQDGVQWLWNFDGRRCYIQYL